MLGCSIDLVLIEQLKCLLFLRGGEECRTVTLAAVSEVASEAVSETVNEAMSEATES